MDKNYKEMTQEQLKEELKQIIKEFRLMVCGDSAILQLDIDRLESVLKRMNVLNS